MTSGGIGTDVADLLLRAFEEYGRRRPQPAAGLARQVLQLAPGQPDALHILAVIAHEEGQDDRALELDESAIAANPSNAAYHAHRALVLESLQRLDDAIASYRLAASLRPDAPHLPFNLGNALRASGRIREAIDSYRQALTLNAAFAEAHNNLGSALHEVGEADEAIASYRAALNLRPDYADALYNLANSLRELGQFDAATAAYERVIALKPGHARAHHNLGLVLIADGKVGAALSRLLRAWAIEQMPEFKASIAQCIAYCQFDAADRDLRALLTHALSEAWARPRDLARAAARFILADPLLGPAVVSTSATSPEVSTRDLTDGALGEVLRSDALLRALMQNTPVTDTALEAFLTRQRRVLLLNALGEHEAETRHPGMLEFWCALAQQCFLNEYVFAATAEELEEVRTLCGHVERALVAGHTFPATWLAAIASYAALGTMPWAGRLAASSWPPAFEALLTQQVAQPLKELSLKPSIAAITPVAAGVSQEVQRQYEENPYPRWTRAPVISPFSPDGSLRRAFRPSRARGSRTGAPRDILVAGCGTGQESIDIARGYPGSRVLAIDLSRASLAYATRKAQELGITNIEHAQADILELGSTGREFDLISSVGVLHHMQDPVAGWRGLAALLSPGGLMLTGLYSETGRRDVIEARRYLESVGIAPTADAIRKCRQALIGPASLELRARNDFYTMSECRDLLFHVQEHRYSLPVVAQIIGTLGLEFVGLSVDPVVARHFHDRFPGRNELTDLDAWHSFEQDFPRTFSGMYLFWLRKPE